MENKTELMKMKKSYTKTPTKLLNSDISALALSIYFIMAMLPEDFNPSVRFLMKKLKLAPATVVKYMKELIEKNLIIQISKGGSGHRSKYAFVSPEYWKVTTQDED